MLGGKTYGGETRNAQVHHVACVAAGVHTRYALRHTLRVANRIPLVYLFYWCEVTAHGRSRREAETVTRRGGKSLRDVRFDELQLLRVNAASDFGVEAVGGEVHQC